MERNAVMVATDTLQEKQILRQIAHPLTTPDDLDPLIDRIGDARFVLLGEASHGTSEYYQWRARISQRLIQEKDFTMIAVEGDWPDCYRINRYIKNYEQSGDSAWKVLHQFSRWPTWMWANWEIAAFVEWLRRHNDTLPVQRKVGFYGLDVYSLWESLGEVTRYLEHNMPDNVHAAYRAYRCFQPYGEDPHTYAYATADPMVADSCETEVLDLLFHMQRNAGAGSSVYDGDSEAHFNAEQNAYVALNAEHYYRTMIQGNAKSWNIRDHHMVDTLNRLVAHYGDATKVIIWQHNTHIGDARATPMADAGMVNVGQLVRDEWKDEGVVLVGFGAYRGSVIAGSRWDAPMERMPVPEAQPESWEGLLHDALGQDSLLIFSESSQAHRLLQRMRGHRAIGVVYNPERERGNFVPTAFSRRYDAFIYLEDSHALHPLHIDTAAAEPPDTYPWGV